MPTPSTEATEIELKFALLPGARAALEAGVLRGGTSSDLFATYFDTHDTALFRGGYGLRVRRKGERFIQTLKSHGDGLFDRGEWEAEVPSAALDLAVLAATPAAAFGDQALSPLFEVDVRRTAAVTRHGASRIEVSLDIGEVRAGGRSEPIEEVELELLQGEVADLFAFARSLDAPLVLAFATKSERGYRLASGLVPELDGAQAELRRLSAAILAEDRAAATMTAAILGLTPPDRAAPGPDWASWARLLLEAAERASSLPER